MWNPILIILLITLAYSIEFTINLEPLAQYCGYEHLLINTKYFFSVYPHAQHDTEIEVKTMSTNDNPEVKIIYSDHNRHSVRLSKLAPQTNFYSFCVRNKGSVPMDFNMGIQTGLELMDFTNTPDMGQKQLINHELSLLQNEMSSLMSELQSIQHAKINTQGLFNMLSVRTLGFGILGGVVLGLVNIGLYYEIRKTLKEHKLA